MTFYEYLRNVSPPRAAVILGYIADTNPGDDVCCPLRQLGKCKFMTESYDCCESWADYLMEDMTEKDKKFWEGIYGTEILFTQEVVNRKRLEKTGGTVNEDAVTGVYQSGE